MKYALKGTERLSKRTRQLADPKLLEQPFTRAGFAVARYMLIYPTPPPNSSYDRTGRYGREWDVTVSLRRGNLSATYTNYRPGAEYVGSEEKQARIHRQRWRTDEQAINEVRPRLIRDIGNAIKNA